NYSYADYADQSLTLKPADVVDLLNKGTALTLQANNDITIASPLLVTATGGAGKLTVQAGRNLSFNANVTTGNADLLAVAGDTAADGAYRDAGASNLTIAGGVTLNVGTGTATLAAIGGNFVNNAGAIGVGGSGRYLIYAADPATSTEGFSGYNKHYNQAYSATAPSYAASGNWIMYSVAPTLTVTPTATTVEYGATPTIGAGYSGFIDGDTATDISGTASYAIGGANSSSGNPIVGVHNLAYSSGLSSNLGYQLIDSSVSLNELTVTAKPLSLTGIGAVDKTYDATLTATLSGAGAIAPISGDAVTLGGTGIGSFADKNVGIGKTVTIAGFSLSGADAGNYSIVQPTATATIAPADLSIGGVGADNKVYDATTTATLNGAPTVTPLSGDSVTVGGAGTGSFADKNVGIGKTVTIVGYSLSGADASNYNIVQPSATATIGAKPVSVSGISADNKTYDGTTIAGVSDAQATIAGLIAGDTVSIVSSGSFVDKNVGVGKTVTLSSSYSGADVGNYSITDQTATTADIVAKALTLSGLRADDKTYDGTTAATVASYGSLQGVIATDTVSLLAPSSIDSASSSDAHFESADVGSNKIVYVPGLTLAGADAANYRLSTPQTTQASILAASGSTGASGAVDAGQLSASTAAASSTTGATTGATADATIVAASAQGQTTATTLTISDSGVGGGESSGAASSADSTTASVATSSATVAQAATKPLVKTAGLSMTDMSAMIQARHEFRTETFRDALDILRKQPDQAQLGDCQSSGDTLCIPAARKDIDIAEPTPTVRKRIAVMFANAAYTGAIPALESPTKDAAVIGETLRSRFDYDVKIVDNATQADIVRALKTLAETTERDDSVLIFYAGHGYQMNDTRMGYWLPVDASNKSPAKWLSNSDIARFLDAIPAKQLMLVSDSCFSGTFTEQKLKDTQIRMKRDDVLRQRSVVAISSGGEEPVSDEGRDGHSIFAWSLIETLKNLPESTMAVDMHKSIKDSVMKEFPQEPQFGAIRSARHNEGGDYVMEPKTGK
ncbi:MAG TPA: YDG domain-containing protein, partial [Rhodocyclaceae bacterium]|nr:YDG domain-containing protein [Rhodocyclaceae bacterium]